MKRINSQAIRGNFTVLSNLKNTSKHFVILTLLNASLFQLVCPSTSFSAGKPTYAKKMQLGQLLYFNGNVDQAIKAFKYAAVLNPEAFEPHLNLVNIYVQKQDIPQAILECRQGLKIKDNHKDLHLILGNLLRTQAGNTSSSEEQKAMLEEASKEISKAEELGADKALVQNTLGVIHVQKGDLDKALVHVESALAENNKLADAHLIRGVLKYKKGDKETAIKELDLAVKHKGKNAEARNTKADILFATGKHDDAIEEYKRALEDDNRYSQAYVGMANIYIQRGKYEEALAELEKAKQIKPEDKNILYSIGVCLEKLNKIDLAIQAFQEGVLFDTDPSMSTQIKVHIQQLQQKHLFSLPAIGGGIGGLDKNFATQIGPGNNLFNGSGQAFFGESFKDLIKIKGSDKNSESAKTK